MLTCLVTVHTISDAKRKLLKEFRLFLADIFLNNHFFCFLIFEGWGFLYEKKVVEVARGLRSLDSEKFHDTCVQHQVVRCQMVSLDFSLT